MKTIDYENAPSDLIERTRGNSNQREKGPFNSIKAGLILCLLFAFALRVSQLDKYGLWDGEIHNIFHAMRPLADFPQDFRAFTAHPPLSFVLTHITRGQELSLWMIRFPSVLVGTLAVAASYVFARYFFTPSWALTVAWLLAISPLSLRWSQSIRMYGLFLLFSTLSFILTLRLQKKKRRLTWLWLGLVSLLNLYTHYFALFPLIAEMIFISVMALGLFKGFAWGEIKKPKRLVRHALLSAVIVALGFLPWFLSVARYNFIGRQLGREGRGGGDELNLQFLYRLFEDLTGGMNWVTPVLIILVCLGLFNLLGKGRRRQLLLITLSILVPLFIIILVDPRRFHAKYLAFVTIPLIVLITSGVKFIQDHSHRLIHR